MKEAVRTNELKPIRMFSVMGGERAFMSLYSVVSVNWTCLLNPRRLAPMENKQAKMEETVSVDSLEQHLLHQRHYCESVWASSALCVAAAGTQKKQGVLGSSSSTSGRKHFTNDLQNLCEFLCGVPVHQCEIIWEDGVTVNGFRFLFPGAPHVLLGSWSKEILRCHRIYMTH